MEPDELGDSLVALVVGRVGGRVREVFAESR